MILRSLELLQTCLGISRTFSMIAYATVGIWQIAFIDFRIGVLDIPAVGLFMILPNT